VDSGIDGAAAAHPLAGMASEKSFLVPAPDRSFNGVVPLTAVYLLAPVPADAERPAHRARLDGAAATLALLGNARAGALAAQAWAPALLDRCAAVAAGTAVYRLEIARDLSRLPSVVETLLGWHAPAPARR